jgi:hypothetical protein
MISDLLFPTIFLGVLPILSTIFEDDEEFKLLIEEEQPIKRRRKKLKVNLNKDLPSLPLDEDELNIPSSSTTPPTGYSEYNSDCIKVDINHKDYIIDWSNEVALKSSPSKPIPFVDETNLNLVRSIQSNESGWIKYNNPIFPQYSNRLTRSSLYENHLRDVYGIRDDNLIIKENFVKKIKKFFINLFNKKNNDFNKSQ